MSHVRFHEDIGLNSRRFRCNGLDHFWGDQLDARWYAAGDAGGSAVVVDGIDGGIVRITTGNVVNNDYNISWQDIKGFIVSKQPTLEVRSCIDNSSDTTIRIGLYRTSDENIVFLIRADEANIQIACYTGGSQTIEDIGVPKDTNWHIYRIEVHTHGSTHVHFYLDGVECTGSPITTNIPTQYMQPYINVRTNADVVRQMDVDYVYWRQDR